MDAYHWLASENVCLAGIFFALALGATLTIATSTPRDVRLAHWFFGLGYIWLSICVMQWLIHSESDMKSYVLAFMIGGVIFIAWLRSARWVEANYKKQSDAIQGQVTPTPTSTPAHAPAPSQNQKAPGHHNNQQQQNNSGGTNTQQSTTGANSPIITGDGNKITINPEPKVPQGFHEAIPEYSTISIGESAASYTVPTATLNSSPHSVLKIGGTRPLKMHLKNGAIYCDVAIWEGEGLPSIEISENEFKVRPTGWDRNFTDNAFEVIDSHGKVMFQMIRKTAGHFVAQGMFPMADGGLVIGLNSSILVRPSQDAIDRSHIEPVFKYPSWKYPGKYADGSN
jgi:hypothetical protein